MSQSYQYVYSKCLGEFGKPARLRYIKAPKVISIQPDPALQEQFIMKTEVDCGIQSVPSYSLDEVQTIGKTYCTKLVDHTEGGWPRDVNRLDVDQVARYRKRIENDEYYTIAVMYTGEETEGIVRQNNAIDIYGMYFDGHEEGEREEQKLYTQAVLRLSEERTTQDGGSPTSVSKLSFCSLHTPKLASAHCTMKFNDAVDSSAKSYIWSLETMTCESSLSPISSLTTIAYNPRDPFCVAGGCHNGQVVVWDTRKNHLPILESIHHSSHYDAVLDLIWIQSKGNTDFFTAGSGGEVKWWDTRKMREPYDTLLMDVSGQDLRNNVEGIYGLAYESTMPAKFLVATDGGRVVLCSRHAKSPAERIGSIFETHMGPVYTVQRNQAYPKNFLVINAWRASIWCDDIKERPLLTTPLSMSEMTDGCWNPQRPGAFYITKANGILEVWDLIHSHSMPLVAHQVTGGAAISAILLHEDGTSLACGDDTGNIHYLNVPSTFATTTRIEQKKVHAFLEAETRCIKLIEHHQRDLVPKKQVPAIDRKDAEVGPPESLTSKASMEGDREIQQVDDEFFAYIGEEKEKLQNLREAFIRDEMSTTEIFTSDEKLDDGPGATVNFDICSPSLAKIN